MRCQEEKRDDGVKRPSGVSPLGGETPFSPLWSEIKKRVIRRRIALGVGEGPTMKRVIGHAERAQSLTDVVVVGPEQVDVGVEYIRSDHPEETLIDLLLSGEVDGVVRGNLDAAVFMKAVRSGFPGSDPVRLAFLRTHRNQSFFLAPVGIDEGRSKEELIRIGVLSSELLQGLGIKPIVGVLSKGRRGDIGRSPIVDRSMETAEEVVNALEKQGIHAVNSQILIETAVDEECPIILAPDGVIGNYIFRTLCLVGGGMGSGAPILGIGKPVVDTSRSGSAFYSAIMLASALRAIADNNR